MTQQRLPQVNSDDGTWGALLLQYLTKEHYQDSAATADFAPNGSHKNINIFPGTTTAAPITFASTFTSSSASGSVVTNAALLTTPVSGSMEYDGSYFYLTQSGTRKKIAIYDDASGVTGDIYYRNSAGALIRLPVGGTNTLLSVSGGIPAWTTSTFSTTPAANTLAEWDGNYNLSANAFMAGYATTATAAGVSLLYVYSPQIQAFTGSSTQTVRLPSASVPVGAQWRIVNNSTGPITVTTFGGTGVTVLSGNTNATFTALVATPTNPADWDLQYDGTQIAQSKALTVSNSLTLSGTDGKSLSLLRNLTLDGTDGTTMTFPSVSDVVVGLTGTQTLSNKTLTAPIITAPTISTATLSAGTTTTAPLKFTSGTNLTTATAGVIEYDGTLFYATPTSTSRQLVQTEQFVTLTTAYTLTSQTAAQKMFNTTTNGAVTLPIGSYFFECLFTLSNLSNGAGTNFGWTLAAGTATIAGIMWKSEANKASLTVPATAPTLTVNTAANTAIATASAIQTGWAHITGKVRISVAGTVIPQVSLSTATAAIVAADSHFRIWDVGSNTVTNVGSWS